MRLRKTTSTNGDITVRNTLTTSTVSSTVTITSSGKVYLNDLNLELVINIDGDTDSTINSDIAVIHVENFTQIVDCSLKLISNSQQKIRTVSVIDAVEDSNLLIGGGNSLISEYTSGTLPLGMYIVGKISLANVYDEEKNKLTMSGDFQNICTVKGGYFYRSVTTNMTIEADGSVTGKRYEINRGGRVSVNGGGEEFFPGTEAGTVESSTYSWYR